MRLEQNQPFGNYIYIGESISIGKYSQKKLLFRCKCGKTKKIRPANISSNASKTCGRCSSFILKKQTRFEKLTYTGEDTEIQKESQKKLLFRCDCGREKDIAIFTVFRGRVKKCGDCNLIYLSAGIQLGEFRYEGSEKNVHLHSNKKFPFTCKNGHLKERTIKSAKNSTCLSCRMINLNDGDSYGTFRYVGESILIGKWSKQKLQFLCKCGTEKKIAISSITNGDIVSCTNCYSKIHDWFIQNKHELRSLKCPIEQNDIPPGGVVAVGKIKNKATCFEAICPICKKKYSPRFSDIRRGQCITCGCTKNRISRPAKEIFEFVQSLNLEPEFEFELDGRFFDIFISKSNLAIELNGLRWHSKPESRSRDLYKYALAQKHGISLLVIFEDEWNCKKKIMQSIIKNRLGASTPVKIRSSSCEVKVINSNLSKKFYEEFHYIGKCASTIHFGIFFEKELIGCASFRRPSRQSKYDYEISRMAMNPEFRVYGIWSKLFKLFVSESKPQSVVSFSDNRLFNGGVYEKLGFQFDGLVRPDYYWVKGNYRFHKSRMRKNAGSKITETKLREEQGYSKIWDLGKKRWTLIL